MTQDQIQQIAQKRAENLENFIACYIVETGLKASEIELVEMRSEDGLQTKWFCRPISQHVFNGAIHETDENDGTVQFQYTGTYLR
jgi:hypothetical protein